MRTVKTKEHSAKRDQILAAALAIIYDKGYRDTSIRDIISTLGISKGAFYHYFDSKQALLLALIERMKKLGSEKLERIASDTSLTAIQKFNHYFASSIQWKSENKSLTLQAMRLWYTDQNALFRQKLTSEALRYTSPVFTMFIEQGVQEKVFTTKRPKESATILAGMALNLSDEVVRLLLSDEPIEARIQSIMHILEAYIYAIEKILGAPAGSFDFGIKNVRAALLDLIHSD